MKKVSPISRSNKGEIVACKTLREFPQMRACIQSFSADQIQENVLRGEVDIGVGLFKKRPHLQYISVGSETICHYISESHPLWKQQHISKKDIASSSVTWLDIINRSRNTLNREIFGNSTTNVNQSSPVLSYVQSLEAAEIILRSGTSIVPLPDWYPQRTKSNFKYRSLDDIFPPRRVEISIAYNPQFALSCPPVCYLLSLLKAREPGNGKSRTV